MTRRDPAIGAQIQALRLLRGWSIRHAASRAGISHATWSRIERGLQTADNRFVLASIAAALECSPADLTNVPAPAADWQAVAAHAGTRGILEALVDVDLAEPAAGPAPMIGELAGTLSLVADRVAACDYAAATRLLPTLLRDLHVETAGPARGQALRFFCTATFLASTVLRNLGYPSESWLAATRCHEAAEATGDPVLLAYAAFAQASAANVCGSPQRGLTLAERAADEIIRQTGLPGGLELLGSLQLVCAWSSKDRGRLDDTHTWISEAAKLAARAGETTTMGLFFGPTNVDIWRVSIDVDPGRAASVAAGFTPAPIPARLRQVFYYADTALALAALGKDREAVRFLLTAERIAPQHVHTSTEIRDSARLLLSRHHAAGPELRGLYGRMRTV